MPYPSLNLIVIRSSDLDRANRFYGTMGLEFTSHAHGKGPIHLACELGQQVFEIYPLGEGDLPTTSARIGFGVPSVDEAYVALLEAGGQPMSPPKDSPWGRRAVVVDPDGHRVELTQ
jgi:lactoylglutathione lyase